MKHIFKNKWGVTLLEGVIALGLLSLAVAATFGVLLSVSRKSSRPDIQEEMLWAVERAREGLQMYVGQPEDISSTSLPQGLCANATSAITDTTPLAVGDHQITCLLPAICDRATSSFAYTVSVDGSSTLINSDIVTATSGIWADNVLSDHYTGKSISFQITCGGFTL